MDINKIGTNLKDCFTMEYDLVIGNPPYMRDLHLKILDEVYKHVKEGGEIVWLAPITRLVDIRNIYNNLSIKKFNEYNYIWNDIVSLYEFSVNEMIKIFTVIPPNKVGMIKIEKNKKLKTKFSPDYFINLSSVLKEKIKFIINILSENKFATNKKNNSKNKFKLNIPFIHGMVGTKNFYTIFSSNYNNALKVESNKLEKLKGTRKFQDDNQLFFKTETDRYNYWKFWNSDFGRFLISLVKINLHNHVIYKYIPYLWFESEEEAKKFFDITDDEIAEIAKVTMTYDK